MNLRDLLPVCLAAAALATSSPAQEPGFGDLSTGNGAVRSQPEAAGGFATGTGDGGAVSVRVDHGEDRVDRLLEASAPLLEKSLGSYAAMVKAATYQTDAGLNKYLFDDKARYKTALQHADALSADLLEAYGSLRTAAVLIEALERSADSLPALERRLEWTRQATLFDTLLLWGKRRRLTFDTMALGDEESRLALTTADQLESLELPRKSGVRAGPVLLPGRTEALASRYVASASAALDRATDAKALIERENQARGEARETSVTGWITYRFTTNTLFDSAIKPAAVDFAVAMARAKADFNAALLATEAPTHGFSETNHNELRALMMRYAPLLHWGDYHFLVVRNWAGLQSRNWYLFDGGGYRKVFHVQTGGLESKHFEDVMAYFKRLAPKS